jgi:hypothetical protein
MKPAGLCTCQLCILSVLLVAKSAWGFIVNNNFGLAGSSNTLISNAWQHMVGTYDGAMPGSIK